MTKAVPAEKFPVILALPAENLVVTPKLVANPDAAEKFVAPRFVKNPEVPEKLLAYSPVAKLPFAAEKLVVTPRLLNTPFAADRPPPKFAPDMNTNDPARGFEK